MVNWYQQKRTNVILVLSFICFFNGCACLPPPILPTPGAPPTRADIKHETSVEIYAASDLEMPAAVKPEPQFYLHKVSWPYESFWLISKWYTGNVTNWQALAKSNPSLNPDQIFMGNTISIPEELLITRIPMPSSFVKSAIGKKDPPRSSSNTTSTQSESPKLFGPIESEQTPAKSITVELFPPIE